MGESGNWQLTTGNCFSKSFQDPTLGAACEDTTTPSSHFGDTAAGVFSASAQVTFACDIPLAQRFSTTLGKFVPSQNGN